MVSVGHIPPNSELSVTYSFGMPLFMADMPMIRIPVSVGDIYGKSPMKDTDDLTSSRDVSHKATLSIKSSDKVLYNGKDFNEPQEVLLNSPIDLLVDMKEFKEIIGSTFDNKKVVIKMTTTENSDQNLNVNLLMDNSGSMGASISSRSTKNLTVHKAFIEKLTDVAEALGDNDLMNVFEFNSYPKYIGLAKGSKNIKH
jgi:hypothetical protein